MIISHSKKFIFIKPTKVAGSSLEVALAKNCKNWDIVVLFEDYDSSRDENTYYIKSRNAEGWGTHDWPSKIKKLIGTDTWNEYHKITIVRNPWDMLVSRMYWQEMLLKPLVKEAYSGFIKRPYSISWALYYYRMYRRYRTFGISNILEQWHASWNNEPWYFDQSQDKYCDTYLRFEHLQQDYEQLCEVLDLQQENLPRLKTKVRKSEKHYSQFYNEKQVKEVARLCAKTIEHFDYRFEEKQSCA